VKASFEPPVAPPTSQIVDWCHQLAGPVPLWVQTRSRLGDERAQAALTAQAAGGVVVP